MDQYIGRLLDNRYEILEVIGTGGMAVVYKARCHRLNRLVAIKILKDDYKEDEDFRSRFHSESQAVAMLSHPNIVSVYDVSTSVMADYIVMELVEGISLKQYMEKKGVLNWKETLHFAIQIAKALEHAHSRGIVHRDIKPHNVMVLKDGSVKVMDFGIARMMSKGNTLTKEALGSVHYISPEQAKGGRVDNRSDLYSLGVVMYEMMSGRPPYDGETPVAVAIAHINGGAALPSTMNPNIPGGLEQIIMKGMEQDPAKRFASASEMLRDMDEFRKNPSVLFDYNGASSDDVIHIHRPTQPVQPVIPAQPVQPVEPVQQPGAAKPQISLAEKKAAAANAVAAQRAKDRERLRKQREEQERKRNRITAIAIASCILVMLIGIGVLLYSFWDEFKSSAEMNTVEVPDLVGKNYEDVKNDYDLKIEATEVFSDDIPAGIIIKQYPEEGVSVAKGSKVLVDVSKGKMPQTLPNLVGMDVEQVHSLLTGTGIAIKPEYVFSEQIAAGKVISCDVAEGTALKDITTKQINLVVSFGRQPVMGTLTNMTEEEAKKELEKYGVVKEDAITIIPENSDEVEEGKVIRSEPAEGKKLEMDQKVTLYVSIGKEVITSVLPEIIGMDGMEAVEALTKAGFDHYTYDYKASDKEKGTVIEQSPEEFSELDVTTEIVFYLSDGSIRTKNLTFALPTEEELDDHGGVFPEDYESGVTEVKYMLSIKQGDTVIQEEKEVVFGAVTTASIPVTGSGVCDYVVYINGQPWRTISVDFTVA